MRRMRRMPKFEAWWLGFLLLLGLAFGASAQKKNDAIAVMPPLPMDFAGSLQRLSDSLAPGVRLGVSVRSVRGDSLLYQVAGDEWFVPASTLKIIVTAAAVQSLGLDYAPETRLHLEGWRRNRTFEGILRVEGRGDPNISGRYFPDALYPLRGLADSLRARGIDTLRGTIVADTSYYRGGRRPEGWRRNFFDSWYGAEISSLSFNDNCVLVNLTPGTKIGDTVRVELLPDVGYVQIVNHVTTASGMERKHVYAIDSVQPVITLGGTLGVKTTPTTLVLPVRNPAGYFLAAFQKALAAQGVVYAPDSQVYRGMVMDSIRFSATPLRSMLDEINQRSQNLHAEMLLRNLGQWRWGEGSTAAGLRAERLFLHEAGLPAGDFVLVDGCGLSPENRLKPNALTRVLTYMARQPRGGIYMQTLGLPGVSGPNGRRLTEQDAAHRTRFKTGFINGVHGLTGYIVTQDRDTLAVAVYLNNAYKITDVQGRALLDSIWGRVSSLYNKEFSDVQEARALWERGRSVLGWTARLDYYSAQLKGRPYQLGPTGEGMGASLEKGPLMNMAAFDCVTYLEHVMALASASAGDSVFTELQKVRYVNGQIDYAMRKHYFVEDWVRNNADRVRLLAMPGDTTITRVMDKHKFFGDKGIVYNDSNPTTSIPYLPMDKAIAFADVPWSSADTVLGVAFVANIPSICVTHTGFLIAKKGQKPVLRHASQLQKQTADQPLAEYLRTRKGKSPGVLFFEFLDPRKK